MGIRHSLPPQLVVPLAPAPKSKAPMIMAALAALAILAGFIALGGSPAPTAPATVQAEPSTTAAVTPAPTAANTEPETPPAVVKEAPVAAVSGGPAPAGQAATVLVSLRSTPPGAMVVVDSKEYGPTPTQVEWTGAEAAFGREVTFRFQRKGYRDLTVTRQIRTDRLEVEAPPMDPIPVRRPTRDDRPAAAAPTPKANATVTPVKGYKAEPY